MTDSDDGLAASRVATRLRAVGYELGVAPPPLGSYIGARRDGAFVRVSGHTDRGAAGLNGTGPLEPGTDLEGPRHAAALAAVNLLSAVAVVCDLDHIVGPVHLRGYVAASPSFDAHPQVIDGASAVLHLAFDEPPPHTRAAVGVASLPGGAIVELEATFLLADGGRRTHSALTASPSVRC